MKSYLIPRIVFLGEGPSDVTIDDRTDGFAGLRPMVFAAVCRHAPRALSEKWLRRQAEDTWTPDLLRDVGEEIALTLNRKHEWAPVHTVRKGEKASAGIINRAYFFGLAAAEAEVDYAVFFHDCDRLPLTEMAEAVKTGARLSKFEGMVVMTPCPTSEAWILAGLKNLKGRPAERITPANAEKFEDRLRGNDNNPRSAKAQLAQWVTGNADAMALDSESYRDCVETLDRENGWESVECLPSLRVFVESIVEVTKHVKISDEAL